MKKWLIVLLISFSFLLFGCTKKEGEITTKKLNVKDFYTEELIDAMTTKIGMTHKTLNYDVEIYQRNPFMIVFIDQSVYHILTDKFLAFDKSLAQDIVMYEEYLYVEFNDKHLVFSYKTGEQIFEFVKSHNKNYAFYDELIIVFDDVEGSFKETKRYQFRTYELLEEPDKKNPLESFEFGIVKDYQYSYSNDGITLFKDNKFYDYYAFEPYLDGWYFLENGNILSLYIIPLLNDDIEYDYLEGSQKYSYHYVLYNTGKKKAERLELDILIRYIFPKTEMFPFKFDNYVSYQKIDKETKMLQNKSTQGAISNDLKTVYPLEFDFGVARNIIPLFDDLFAVQTEYGMVLINGKNKVINQLLFDNNRYNTRVYKNATVMLMASNEAFLYNLKTGELIKGGVKYTYIGFDSYILKDEENDKYYLFYSGELLQLNGKAERVKDYLYKVEHNTSYNYYYIDNTFLFNTDSPVNCEQIYNIYHSTSTIYTYLCSYKKNGAWVYEIIRVTVDHPIVD